MKYIFKLLVLLLFIACSNSNDFTPDYPVPPKPIEYTDDQIIEMVQKDALKYFWDYAHPTSKLARERYHTDDPGNDANIVTTGGSGFGLMTILVGINKGYITRADGASRLSTALNFLGNASRFHGAWSHWMDGNSGGVIPFGTKDNGGDLVETSFVAQSLICIREYFKDGTTDEKALAAKADELWKGIDYNWYTKGGEDVLYWHWSPNYDWEMNHKLQGYNETLITYILAAASPNYSPSNIVDVYNKGWARSGAIKNGGLQFGMPVIFDYSGASGNVGPMFWAHYSYLGLDPRGLSDQYANYGDLVTNHAKIMYEYCKANPRSWTGYSAKNWGLTASYSRNSDGSTGYNAHQPNNDLGVISPTAAISNIPYTPTESMAYLKYLYNEKKDKYVGVCGPYDAYSEQYNWVTPRYLAIDQGTIAPMVENYKTQFLWKLFMNAPEVKAGLIKLGFHSTTYGF